MSQVFSTESQPASPVFARATLFGIPLVVSSVAKFGDWLVNQLKNPWPAQKQPLAVMVVSMQDLMAKRRQPKTAAAFKSFDYFTMDGMPLVWLARCLGYPAERIYGPDLFAAILERTQSQPIKHYFYGGTPQTLLALQKALLAKWPRLTIAGSYAPPFRALTLAEQQAAIQQINQTQPDIVWVGLGSWKQLEWVSQTKSHLKTKVIIPVGMAFDIWAGVQLQAPRWMQRGGLEWFFRLIHQPGRLWQRYVFQLPVFGVWWLEEMISQLWRRWR